MMWFSGKINLGLNEEQYNQVNSGVAFSKNKPGGEYGDDA
jgi:hypothetical protein